MLLLTIWQGRLGGLRLIMMLAVLTLVMIGLFSIHASGRMWEFNKQVFWIGVGLVAFAGVNTFHYKQLGKWSYSIYALSIILLALVLVGKELNWEWLVPPRKGSFRWIKLHSSLSIQPSEIAKIGYILAFSWYLRNKESFKEFSTLIKPFFLFFSPMVLILLEPDLGTFLLFLPVLFGMLFVAGARFKHLLLIMLAGVMISPVFYLTLKDYQKTRIIGMIKQNSEDVTFLRGDGYQLYQSKTCIGSGGLTGQGLGKGVYVERPWLPDRHNDFIFALIAHQWGFVGGVAVMFLYLLIIIGGLEIAAQQIDPFGKLLAVGLVIQLGTQMFINMGMTMGIMPVTGLTLPFVSYGGSSLVVNFMALGVLVNIARHRPRLLKRHIYEENQNR